MLKVYIKFIINKITSACISNVLINYCKDPDKLKVSNFKHLNSFYLGVFHVPLPAILPQSVIVFKTLKLKDTRHKNGIN